MSALEGDYVLLLEVRPLWGRGEQRYRRKRGRGLRHGLISVWKDGPESRYAYPANGATPSRAR